MAVDPLDTSDRAQLAPREVAERFVEVFYRQNRLVEAFRAWVHPDYIQHDPNSATGRDGTIAALDAHMKRSPAMSHDLKRILYGDDGTIAVHYHFKHAPDQRGLAVVDLFRIENGYLVEHLGHHPAAARSSHSQEPEWDVLDPDPSVSANNVAQLHQFSRS